MTTHIYVLVHHAEFGREAPWLVSAWPSLESAQKAFETGLSKLDGEVEYTNWTWKEIEIGVWAYSDPEVGHTETWDTVQRVEVHLPVKPLRSSRR